MNFSFSLRNIVESKIDQITQLKVLILVILFFQVQAIASHGFFSQNVKLDA